KSIQWGISPFGIWEHKEDNKLGSDTPIGSTSNNRDIYADTRKWVQDETIDYIIPQVYWEFTQAAAPYGEIAKWWNDTVEGKHTQLYIGHANYKHMNAGWSKAWGNPEEIGNQMKFNNNYKNIQGSAFFGYTSLLKQENPDNKPGILAQNRHIDLLKDNYFTKKVLVPAKPWLDKIKTTDLTEIESTKNNIGTEFTFKDSTKNDTRFYVLYSNDEILKVIGRDKKNENQKLIISNDELKGKAVTGISIKDRAGVETKIFSVK
ncbi:MAG: glycoside hydrolase family 10 protein, partial [Fusobacteriaceae bacterium]